MLKNAPNLKASFRDMSIEDIMSCMFGLRKFETETYFKVVDKGTITVNDLVTDFNKDRSTIQRALQNLAIAGLIYRDQKNIKNGGYYYMYRAAPFEEVKETTKASIAKWADSMIEWMDNLKSD
jgi:predicted transcriptional regulator